MRALPVRAAATVARGPYLQNVRSDGASILWTSLGSADGQIGVTNPDGSTSTFHAAIRTFPPSLTGLSYTYYQYRADLTGLQSGATYSYRILMDGKALTSYSSFKTAGPGKCSFLVFGDSGENTPEQISIIQLMRAERDISFALHMGDLAYPKGTYANYDVEYLGLNGPLMDHIPFFATPGNHDYLADSGAAYLSMHVAPDSGVDPADAGRYYSFDWGDIHFTSVDTNLIGSDSTDRMLAWFENDLRNTRKYWKVVFLHHAPYPTGHHMGDPVCNAAHDLLNPIAEKYGVQLVLGGHEHGYERTVPLLADQQVPAGTGTTYVISGGGGADLHNVSVQPQTAIALQIYHYLRIDVDGGTLTMRAVDLNGNEIERYVIQPAPTITKAAVAGTGDYSDALAVGSLVSIFGQNLAFRAMPNSGFPLSAELGGARVKVGGSPAPLLFVSPMQVNFQIPSDVHGNVTIEFSNDNGTAVSNTTVAASAPSILAVTSGGSPVSPSNPVSPGAQVVVFATGLGVCGNSLAFGAAASTAAPATNPVEVYLTDQKLQPTFAGLATGYAGLNRVDFVIPANTSSGTYNLRVATPDISSRAVPLAVKAASN